MLDTICPPRLRVLGTPVDAVDMPGALNVVDAAVTNRARPQTILAVNPEKVYALRGSTFLADFFSSASLLIPDGIGVVLAARLLTGAQISRVPGADLMQEICAVAPMKGYRIFIFGGREDVSVRACEILRQRHPGIAIVGRANGYVPEEGWPQLVAEINALRPDVLFVGLGSPRQEEWIHRFLPLLQVSVVQGIGGTLDTIGGSVKRAPRVFRNMGFEWLFRLLRQPSRVSRQKQLPRFAWEVFRAKWHQVLRTSKL